MLWGHYWDSESGMTVISLVAKPRYRGVASGIGYTIVKVTAFVTTLVFPALFEAVGVPVASMIIAIAPFCAFLAPSSCCRKSSAMRWATRTIENMTPARQSPWRGMNPRPPNINRPGRRGGPR